MATKRPRLSRSSDFQRIYRQGSSTASRFLVLYSFKRPVETGAEGPRLGLSVSKKLGGAVVRNRVKRLLREAFQGCAGHLAEEYDLVLIARPSSSRTAAPTKPFSPAVSRASRSSSCGRAGVLTEGNE